MKKLLSNPLALRAIARAVRTQDGMLTFDQQTIDSAGVFLIGELERLDQRLNAPLASVSWGRDIMLRSDVSIADETSSFTNTSFAAAGGPSPVGKSWIGKDATAIAGVALDINKTANPLNLWGMELGWTIPELESSMKVGRPVDQQKFVAMNLKYQMDIDEQVYIGDSVINVPGLVNNSTVPLMAAPTGNWATASQDQILADINAMLAAAWLNSAYSRCPTKLLLPPLKFGILVSRIVSSAGSKSLLEYLTTATLAYATNGRPLEIAPLKWLTGRGAGGTDRAIAYTNEEDLLRFPLVPLQRTPMEYRGLRQLTTYYGRLGVVEMPYAETIEYMDGI